MNGYLRSADVIAQWLSQSNPQYEQLLNQCSFSTDASSGEFVVECPTEDLLEDIASISQRMAQPALKLATPWINLSYRGEAIYRFSPSDAVRYSSHMVRACK
jgi:hypothetical protein